MKTSNENSKSSKFKEDTTQKDRKGKKAFRSDKQGSAIRNNSNSCGNGKFPGGERDNDPSWYTAYPGIYSATANLSFNQPVGVSLDMVDESGSSYAAVAKVNVPNVMRFGITFTPGVTTSSSSIINTSMFQNYNYVRHANSGSKNYDAVDLQMYYLAVSEAFALLWHGIRAYGLLNAFSAVNRSIPKVLFSALELDYTTWTANPAQLRARLNLAATKLGSLCIPNNSRLFARMQYLMSNIFMDGDNIKSQMYVFAPYGYHEWGRLSNVGKLTFQSLEDNLTMDRYFEILDTVLAPMLEDEDINIMSGDVLKAYGTAGLTPVPLVPELYSTPIITSAENPLMMSQIENASWLNLGGLNVEQSTNGHIIFAPNYAYANNEPEALLTTLKNLLNSRNAEVSNDEVMEMTRLAGVYDSRLSEDGTKAIITMRACGSEMINKVDIYSYADGTLTKDNLKKVYSNIANVPAVYFQFDWAPILYIGTCFTQGEKLNAALNRIIGDLSNYTAVSKNTMALLHDTAVASEYLLDQPGSKSGNK